MTALVDRLYAEIQKIPLIDPHTHINPHAAASTSLNDLLGYHYYTELAHSAGLPKEQIEDTDGRELSHRLIDTLQRCQNTVQYSWLVEIAQSFFGYDKETIGPEDVDQLYTSAEQTLGKESWTEEVWQKTSLDALFLTNDFDDPLDGFDTTRYVPCLRTDDLVFKWHEPETRERWEACTGKSPTACPEELGSLFEHFVSKGARACAISLPPDFEPLRPAAADLSRALERVLAGSASTADQQTITYGIFYALADQCEEHGLPFDLMIGVRRGVYEAGVYQGQDLFDQRTSLAQFARLFNDKSHVTFPVSVLTHGQNQELASFAWIFPNVVTSGHWWYSNIPVYIEADTRARLEAVPQSKQIGYYSDAYKLEFILPKFNMYRRSLARVLAETFVEGRRWSEERAVDLARQILRGNVEQIFGIK